MLGGFGAEVREPNEIQPTLQQARESVKSSGKSAVINVWVDPNEYAPGTKAQTMYK
jgi:acetolactate synthase-1/2/3 large subunit